MKAKRRKLIHSLIPDDDHVGANFLRNSLGSSTSIQVQLYHQEEEVLDVDVVLPMNYSSLLYGVALSCVLDSRMVSNMKGRSEGVPDWDQVAFIGSAQKRNRKDIEDFMSDDLVCLGVSLFRLDASFDLSVQNVKRLSTQMGAGLDMYCALLYAAIVVHHVDFKWRIPKPKNKKLFTLKKKL